MPYEMFRDKPEEFLDRIFNFTNINPYYPELYEYINISPQNTERKNILTQEQKRLILQIQEQSNKKLAKITNICLKKYGYYA